MRQIRERLGNEVSKTVVGQNTVLDGLLVALAVGGHVLLQGVPGVAKTLIARSFSRALGLDFSRVQFTPDMLPSDVTGTMTLAGGDLTFRAGPVFAHTVLADEINRTPPKTQAALLEAMQEGSVTVDGVRHPLPDPFLVIATQNPIEYEGTYPLPEAQLDRFLLRIDVGYPSDVEESELLRLHRSGIRDTGIDTIGPVTNAGEVAELRRLVDETRVEDGVIDYISALVRFTRTLPAVELGASPRASVHLLAASKAVARLEGRDFVTPDDIGYIAPNVLRHRILVRPEAELDQYTAQNVIDTALATVPVPR